MYYRQKLTPVKIKLYKIHDKNLKAYSKIDTNPESMISKKIIPDEMDSDDFYDFYSQNNSTLRLLETDTGNIV